MLYIYNNTVMDKKEFGWIFLYISMFGFSDFIVRQCIKSDMVYIAYYIGVGTLGLYILNTHS